MVISTARPRGDDALALVKFLSNQDNATAAIEDFTKREEAAQKAEASARTAQKDADASLYALQAKEADLASREQSLATEREKFQKEREAVYAFKASEEQRLSQLSDSLNSRQSQLEAEYKEKMTAVANAASQQSADLDARSLQLEKESLRLCELEKSITKREAIYGDSVAKQSKIIADLKGYLNSL